MGIKISEMNSDTSVGGGELLPVSDAGNPKSVSTADIKNYVIDQIEAITAGVAVATGNDVYMLIDGVLKPVDIDLITQRAIDIVWGKANEAAPDAADKLPLKDGATEKTITLSDLWTYIRAQVLGVKLDDLTSADDNTDLDASASAHGLMSKLDKVKLNAIEALADVTDATNVDAAGALMDSDLLDEDNMASNSAVYPASQQSVKAYVDNNVFDGDVADLNIDGGTDIGADLVDADLVVVDDGAVGVNRKAALSRLWTYVWGKIQSASSKATPVGADIVPIQDSAALNVVKELTLTNLAEFVRSAIESAILDVSDLDSVVALAGTDYMLATQGSTGKKVLVSDVYDAVHAAFGDYVAALATVTTLNDVDEFFVVQSGIAKGATIGDIRSALGNVSTDATTTENNVPQWSATDKKLKDGLEVQSTVRADGTADNDSIATERAVREAIDDGIAEIVPEEVDGTLVAGDNTDFTPTKLVYNKTCSDSTGNDVIDLENGLYLGQILTVYLGTKGGTDNAVITPVTSYAYDTITLNEVKEIATLQWQGATVGWAILFTNGIVYRS